MNIPPKQRGNARRYVRVILSGMLAFILLLLSSVGCSGQMPEKATAASSPFATDRVVTVHIVMATEDWNSCQSNALSEEYVRADFWYDGELVPNVAVRPKGNSSLRHAVQSGTPRFSLKVDFNFFNSTRVFRGLKKLNLNIMASATLL